MTFSTRNGECLTGNKVPREYVVFANLIRSEEDEIRAGSVAKWDENADLRVWKALGKNGRLRWKYKLLIKGKRIVFTFMNVLKLEVEGCFKGSY